MADVAVNFKRPFRLQLANSMFLDFKAGPQTIDEALLKHWYVVANLVEATAADLLDFGVSGTLDYTEEDLKLARALQEEEAESQRRRAKLQQLRTAGVERQIQRTIAGMNGTDVNTLTPIQRELVLAAERQQARQRAEAGNALKDILPAHAVDAPQTGTAQAETVAPGNTPPAVSPGTAAASVDILDTNPEPPSSRPTMPSGRPVLPPPPSPPTP